MSPRFWRISAAAVLITKNSSCMPINDKHSVSRLQSNDKIIHFVRHAEGHHNVAGRNDPLFGYLRKDLEDATLTENGVEQCKSLQLRVQDKVQTSQLLVVSPMHRTMQTALYSFPQLENKIPWIAVESVREQTGLHPCDKRKPISEHRQTYRSVVFDLIEDDLDPLYHKYVLREPEEDVVKRCLQFLTWLSERPEREIIVVTHSAYLRHLFNRVLRSDSPGDREHYENCEMRSYVLRPADVEAAVADSATADTM